MKTSTKMGIISLLMYGATCAYAGRAYTLKHDKMAYVIKPTYHEVQVPVFIPHKNTLKKQELTLLIDALPKNVLGERKK